MPMMRKKSETFVAEDIVLGAAGKDDKAALEKVGNSVAGSGYRLHRYCGVPMADEHYARCEVEARFPLTSSVSGTQFGSCQIEGAVGKAVTCGV